MIALLTGGASCGKSAFAELICTQLGGDLVYLAAMRPVGEESLRRVERHRAQRAGKGFRTIECYDGLELALQQGGLDGATVLLECLGNVAANELFSDEGGDVRPDAARAALERDLDALARRSAHLIVVGNEVGSDGTDYGPTTRAYQELLGTLACGIAARSDLVAEAVAGMPHVLKLTGAARQELGAAVLAALGCPEQEEAVSS